MDKPPADPNTAQAPTPTSAPSAAPPRITATIRGASERDRIITPYDADEFESTLRRLQLLDLHPSLPHRIRFGFPIGDLNPIPKTFTPANHASGIENLDFIKSYIAEQVELGRMTGPYTRSEVEKILGSNFVSSPLAVIEKAGSRGKLRLVQNCSFKDENGISVNSQINSEDFPTKWGTAAQVAEIVRRLSLLRKEFAASERRAARLDDQRCEPEWNMPTWTVRGKPERKCPP
ncbi:hypothetical protein A0H81_00724 [Grifola frondosa]|uniref:Uncharacterized protein n=1 Tax=Grifola frondosa TaxID=5627 RepID=A0A1C7MSS4_GRIFR|nr:hypothetical protein A0H81_00724 [Grifola frondosa]